MGTNFYLRQTPCPTCTRFDEHHIGKRSWGWSFGFRGYRPDDDVSHPLGTVRSRADWVRVVETFDGIVVDENGRTVEDPVAWLRDLEAPNLTQQTWERDHMGPYYQPSDRDWRDPEGFRFYDGEFS